MKLSVAHTILAATAATASARLFTKNEARNLQVAEGEDVIACALIYDPVCDVDGVTHGNSCEAEAAGAVIAFKGECPPPSPVQPTGIPVPCPLNIAPVCGVDGVT